MRCGQLLVDDSQCRRDRGHAGTCASGAGTASTVVGVTVSDRVRGRDLAADIARALVANPKDHDALLALFDLGYGMARAKVVTTAV
jgi:hypothetical protein